jgi:hypothetical protein
LNISSEPLASPYFSANKEPQKMAPNIKGFTLSGTGSMFFKSNSQKSTENFSDFVVEKKMITSYNNMKGILRDSSLLRTKQSKGQFWNLLVGPHPPVICTVIRKIFSISNSLPLLKHCMLTVIPSHPMTWLSLCLNTKDEQKTETYQRKLEVEQEKNQLQMEMNKRLETHKIFKKGGQHFKPTYLHPIGLNTMTRPCDYSTCDKSFRTLQFA